MDQFMVIGLGNFGMNVAANLSKAGKQIIVIDADEKRIDDISDEVTKATVADVRDKKSVTDIISSYKIDVAIISLGNRIEASILATVYLKELKVKKIIAKASNEYHAAILKAVGADEIIFPEKEMALKLVNRLLTPNFIDYIPMAEDYGIIELEVSDDIIGKTLAELRLRNKYQIEIIAMKNVLSGRLTMVPSGNYRIEPDTVMVVVGKNDDLKKMRGE